MTARNERIDRTCAIIERGRVILLKRADGSYLHQWTVIQAGYDGARWSNNRLFAMEMSSLHWAFAIANLYGCKVVSVRGNR